MRHILPLCGLVLVLVAAGCQKAAPDVADPQSLDAVALVAADEMNGPVTAIMTVLRGAGDKSQVGWDTLTIGFNGRDYPINAWLYRGGYLELVGAQYVTRPMFSLSAKAKALVANPDQPWFEVQAGEPTALDCRSVVAVAAGGCQMELTLTPTLTAAGRAALGPVRLEPFAVQAVTSAGVEDWTVAEFIPLGRDPQEIALTAILGPDETREAAVKAALKEVQSRLGLDRPLDAPPAELDPLIAPTL